MAIAVLLLPFILPFIFAVYIFMIIFWVIYILIRFISYIFNSFGLLRIAKKEKYKYPYIAWVPVLSEYILAKYCLSKKKAIIYCILNGLNYITVIFLLKSFSFGINEILLKNIVIVLSLYMLIYFIIEMIVMNKFYKKVFKCSEFFTITTIISFGLLKPIYIYISRFKKITKENI